MGRSDQLRSIAKAVVPSRLRQVVRKAQRNFVFWRAFNRFVKAPDAYSRPGNPALRDLVYGWGNEGWSAREDYLASCIDHALTARGPILECGSGLSTLLIGAIATQRGLSHWALEHIPELARKVERYVSRYRLDAVVLCTNPLKDYGTFRWYDAPLESMPDRFHLVICDGPPACTKGGRYGLVPVMKERLEVGSIILLDDACREQERAIARRWEVELGASVEILNSPAPYIKMTVMPAPHPPTENSAWRQLRK